MTRATLNGDLMRSRLCLTTSNRLDGIVSTEQFDEMGTPE